MRDRRFLIDPEDIVEGKAWIRGAEHRHLSKVLRLEKGDPVAVFDGRGRGFHARLEAVESSRSLAVLGGPESPDVEPRIALTVMASVLHGERMESVVEKVTEIGAVRIVPVVAARSVVRAAPGRWGRLDRLRRIAVAAAKQSGRLVVPEITEPMGFEEAVRWGSGREDTILRALFMAGGEDAARLRDSTPAKEAAILVGPEGGWTEEEAASARAAGWRPIGLGSTTLRSDTAAAIGAALVILIAGRRA